MNGPTGRATARKRLALRVPGSACNLGPGFDALGLALGIYNRLTFDLLEEDDPSIPLVRLKGEIAGGFPTDRSNLVHAVLGRLLQDSPALLRRIRVLIDTDIPPGRGLGSSATAVLGAVWAARALSGEPSDRAEALAEAARLEGHPDNAAASALGGFVVCSPSMHTPAVVTQRLAWPTEWRPLVVVPPYPLGTQESRNLLPDRVRLTDAVSNIQRASLLVSAVANRDEGALSEALHDRIHEPYREKRVPELRILREELSDMPVLGCVLCGAGSSVLVLVNERNRAAVLGFLKGWARQRPQPPQVLDLDVDQEGLQESGKTEIQKDDEILPGAEPQDQRRGLERGRDRGGRGKP